MDFDLRRDATIAHELPVALPPLPGQREGSTAEGDNPAAHRPDQNNRRELRLEELDAQLADPALPAVPAHVEPPPAEPRKRFRLFGGVRR